MLLLDNPLAYSPTEEQKQEQANFLGELSYGSPHRLGVWQVLDLLFWGGCLIFTCACDFPWLLSGLVLLMLLATARSVCLPGRGSYAKAVAASCPRQVHVLPESILAVAGDRGWVLAPRSRIKRVVQLGHAAYAVLDRDALIPVNLCPEQAVVLPAEHVSLVCRRAGYWVLPLVGVLLAAAAFAAGLI